MRNQHRRTDRRAPGELEDEVLAALWSGTGSMTPADVQENLAGALAYTTVMTTLGRLHAKGLATRDKIGRGYAYLPAVDEAAHTAEAMGALLRRRRDRAAVLERFVSDLSAEDEQVLQQLLEGDER